MTVLLGHERRVRADAQGARPAGAVWAAGHPLEDLFFSAVGEAELRYGAAILPTGRRRETLVSDPPSTSRRNLLLTHPIISLTCVSAAPIP